MIVVQQGKHWLLMTEKPPPKVVAKFATREQAMARKDQMEGGKRTVMRVT